MKTIYACVLCALALSVFAIHPERSRPKSKTPEILACKHCGNPKHRG